MMIEMISGGKPLRIPASQVVIYDDHGNPICVAGEYGPVNTHKVAHAGDKDFQNTLGAFGVGRHKLEVTDVKLGPLPGGAKQILGPGVY